MNIIVCPSAREWRRYVRRALREYQITQRELARRLGVKPPQVSDWMTGKVEPGLDTARRVLLTLNRSVARAIRGKVEPGLETARGVRLTLNRSVARAIRGAS